MTAQLLTVSPVEHDHSERLGAFARLSAHGELDVATAPLLTAAFDELIAAGTRVVILDATDLAFVDSSGLREIIRAGNTLHELGGQLFIDGMSGAVQRVLELAGLIERYRLDPPNP